MDPSELIAPMQSLSLAPDEEPMSPSDDDMDMDDSGPDVSGDSDSEWDEQCDVRYARYLDARYSS